MSGHSKWHNIQHKKGAADAARSGLFTKLAREITMAAKLGDKNPDNNPRLRLAILQARKNSMPNDNIKRAIDKASGSSTENYVAVRYEGYGPGAVPVIVEALTDNPRRTVPEVRKKKKNVTEGQYEKFKHFHFEYREHGMGTCWRFCCGCCLLGFGLFRIFVCLFVL